ncbi:hypothetical protein GDO81_023180 [Engystomops pustulosus]|uniref:Uncharacterized protein n=1 Tax=Engystomops pustulosus TaxID=76066 RepID=A0AAV6ZSY8_ENGPU|nr:hypothetical protein GDO81_023180 [Engystomops pustulosus]
MEGLDLSEWIFPDVRRSLHISGQDPSLLLYLQPLLGCGTLRRPLTSSCLGDHHRVTDQLGGHRVQPHQSKAASVRYCPWKGV